MMILKVVSFDEKTKKGEIASPEIKNELGVAAVQFGGSSVSGQVASGEWVPRVRGSCFLKIF
jgi:hypothetical protein